MSKRINRAMQSAGDQVRIGGLAFTVYEYNGNGNIQRCEGNTKPTDGLAGFAIGCIFIDLQGGAATTIYVNEGTSTSSCDFNAAIA